MSNSFDAEELKEAYRVDELNNLYNEYKDSIDVDVSDEELTCGLIYSTLQTVGMPIIYGEFEAYDESVDINNIRSVVEAVEDANNYDRGELSEESVWDYVFADLNTGNVTAHAEDMAKQMVEYYKESEDWREIVDSYPIDVAASAIIYFYRNSTPDATASANHIPFERTPDILDNDNYDQYDVIETYHQLFEREDKSPALKYNTIDSSGVFRQAVDYINELNLDEEEEDNIYYLLYQLDSEAVEYDNKTTALVIMDSILNRDVDDLLDVSTVNKAQFERIKEKTDFSELLN